MWTSTGARMPLSHYNVLLTRLWNDKIFIEDLEFKKGKWGVKVLISSILFAVTLVLVSIRGRALRDFYIQCSAPSNPKVGNHWTNRVILVKGLPYISINMPLAYRNLDAFFEVKHDFWFNNILVQCEYQNSILQMVNLNIHCLLPGPLTSSLLSRPS